MQPGDLAHSEYRQQIDSDLAPASCSARSPLCVPVRACTAMPTAPIALASPDLLVLLSSLFALTLPVICGMAMLFSWYLLFALIHAHTIHRQYMRYTQEKFALAAQETSPRCE
jgi:hypothetical protein